MKFFLLIFFFISVFCSTEYDFNYSKEAKNAKEEIISKVKTILESSSKPKDYDIFDKNIKCSGDLVIDFVPTKDLEKKLENLNLLPDSYNDKETLKTYLQDSSNQNETRFDKTVNRYSPSSENSFETYFFYSKRLSDPEGFTIFVAFKAKAIVNSIKKEECTGWWKWKECRKVDVIGSDIIIQTTTVYTYSKLEEILNSY